MKNHPGRHLLQKKIVTALSSAECGGYQKPAGRDTCSATMIGCPSCIIRRPFTATGSPALHVLHVSSAMPRHKETENRSSTNDPSASAYGLVHRIFMVARWNGPGRSDTGICSIWPTRKQEFIVDNPGTADIADPPLLSLCAAVSKSTC